MLQAVCQQLSELGTAFPFYTVLHKDKSWVGEWDYRRLSPPQALAEALIPVSRA